MTHFLAFLQFNVPTVGLAIKIALLLPALRRWSVPSGIRDQSEIGCICR
jgi:hypothetical protein